MAEKRRQFGEQREEAIELVGWRVQDKHATGSEAVFRWFSIARSDVTNAPNPAAAASAGNRPFLIPFHPR